MKENPMNPLDTLTTLTRRLDEADPRLTLLDRYYAGEQPLSFLAPEAKAALGNRFAAMNSNIPRLAVTSLAERLRVAGFTRDGTPDPALWAAWVRNDLDQLAGVAHREALTLGRSFALVWADDQGRAQVSIESARQVAVYRDPANRQVVAAAKRWVSNGRGHAVLYEPDTITRYTSKAHVSDPAAMPASAWETDGKVIENPLGVVPVVPLVNGDRLLDTDGRSEMADLLPLVDGLNKSLADLMVASEYFARPRRWASGVELDSDAEGNPINPFPEGNRMMISEEAETKFGQLPPADFAAYEAGVNVLLGQIMAVSALPSHYIGVLSNQPASADALRASEASLTARAQDRQATFGRAWEAVARLIVAVEQGSDPAAVDVAVKWADPATRSVAQEADAIVKLHSVGILPRTIALARLGYSDSEVETIRAARRAEALDAAGVDLAALVS